MEFGADRYEPFLKSVTKNFKILPAANWHSLEGDEIDTPDQIIDIVGWYL